MLNSIKKIIADKKEYREQMARAAALPGDYPFVFEKINEYIWAFATGDGSDMLRLQGDILDLFEEKAGEGKYVLDVTGEDVQGFCDGLIEGGKMWTDNYRSRLNRDIMKKLAKNDSENLF